MFYKYFLISIFIFGLIGQVWAEDSWCERDKLRHFLASAVLTGVIKRKLETMSTLSSNKSTAVAVGFCFSVGATKEIWDLRHKENSASLKDLAADGMGIILGIVLP